MTGKERVLKTINHEEPDRVPIGEWGVDHDHVSEILGRHTYWRNRKDTTLALWDNRRDEVVEGMKADYTELIEKLEERLGKKAIVEPAGHQPGDVVATWADVAKAHRLLGYDPQVRIDSGLTRFVQWYRQQEQSTHRVNQ